MLKILKKKILEFIDVDQNISDIEKYNLFTNPFIHTLDNLSQSNKRVKALYSNKSKLDLIYNLSREISKSGDRNRTRQRK